MRILFLGRRYMYFRNFDSVLRELAARGHELHLVVERENTEGLPLVENLAAEFPRNITFGEAPGRADDEWNWVATRLRHGINYLRYQSRLFNDTPMLRERSRERTPGAFVRLGDAVGRHARWLRGPISSVMLWLERATPPDPAMRTFIEAQRPDVVLITPLIDLGSSQIDYLRAARALRIPTALCVWSWDHLSSKALIRELPDRVFVWNHTQRREARKFHRVPANRIVVTGAQCFDRWFDRKPSRDREAFCRDVGLPADRPFILYVCSAPFLGSAPEAPFVADWVRRVRESASPRLRHAPILIRPHPSRRGEWARVDLTRFHNVVLWGSSPVDIQSRADYFDSLYHSALVVGLNTSAFIEAGIVGRPVHTILLPEWHENQLGTVHFRYLFEAGGGLLTSARNYQDHLQQIDDVLKNPSTEIRPFIREFVRPHGLDVPATPVFVKHVEELRSIRVAPPRPVRFERYARSLIERALPLRDDPSREQDVYSEREIEGIVRMRTARDLKAVRKAERKELAILARQERDAARRAALEAHREAKRLKRRQEREEKEKANVG